MNPQGQETIQFFTRREEQPITIPLQARDAVETANSPAAERLDRTAALILAERRAETEKSGKIPPSPLFIP
jgi:hypothetical protein